MPRAWSCTVCTFRNFWPLRDGAPKCRACGIQAAVWPPAAPVPAVAPVVPVLPVARAAPAAPALPVAPAVPAMPITPAAPATGANRGATATAVAIDQGLSRPTEHQLNDELYMTTTATQKARPDHMLPDQRQQILLQSQMKRIQFINADLATCATRQLQHMARQIELLQGRSTRSPAEEQELQVLQQQHQQAQQPQRESDPNRGPTALPACRAAPRNLPCASVQAEPQPPAP